MFLFKNLRMDYDLTRIDYALCGITFPDTLKILPSPGPKSQQKVRAYLSFMSKIFTIGDKSGVLHCLSIKDEEPVVQFKTLPGKPITSVQLASTAGTQADKIFAASGNEVKGYTKKGKVFLAIETALAETITSMSVLGADLILCSGRTVSYYRDLQEFHSYVCEDRVLDIAAFAAPNSTRVRLLVLIANKGAAVLEGGQLVTRAVISSGPSRLIVPASYHGANIRAFYGAADGSIGLITYEESVLSSRRLVESRGFGSVVCFGWYSNSGGTHLAVGRHDGCIQLFLIDLENLTDKPRLKFTYFCGEPVTSLSGGCIGMEENELLVATFSGRIFALRSSRLISGATALASIPHDVLASRRAKLENEVARLEKQVANERDKYQRNTRSIQAGLSTPPLLDIQYELSEATQGWQEVRLISAVPLDMLFIYCKKNIDMQTDTAAVLSICPSQNKDVMATVRCQAGTRRLWVRMRYIPDKFKEKRAESVHVLVYILPAGAPRVARLITLRLPALPYYSQHEDTDNVYNEKRTLSQVRVSGSFSVAEMTSWLTEVLPGELPRPATNITFARRHTLLGTVLLCQYQRGSATFKSDNISTVVAIRNILSNCSVQKGIRIEITCDVPEDCCIKCFKEIEEQFIQQYQRSKDISLKKALGYLDLDSTNDVDTLSLCKDYVRVWEMESPLDSEHVNFEELVDTILQWYFDFRALSVHSKECDEKHETLGDALRNCNIEKIIKILSKEPQPSNIS